MISDGATAWTLARLNHAFFHHYDRHEYDAVLNLFTSDAQYEVHGRRLRGHAQILDALNARSGPELTVRHLVTSQYFHTIEDTIAQGTVSLIAYAGPTPTDAGPAYYPAETAGHIVQLTDHYRGENGHWKIAQRTADMILAPTT